MTKEALKLALEALGWTDEWRPQGLKEEAITAIKEALAQPEREPVVYGMEQSDGEILDVISPEEHKRVEGGYTVPLYRHPQCTWVGLTKEEFIYFSSCCHFKVVDEIEKLLQRKNT